LLALELADPVSFVSSASTSGVALISGLAGPIGWITYNARPGLQDDLVVKKGTKNPMT
jgi:hypothetical protein